MNIIERTIGAISPQWASRRQEARTTMAKNEIIESIIGGGQGYGAHGGSTTRKSLRAFNPRAGDADADIHKNLNRLRPRSRDLFMGGALANGGLKTMRTNIIGTGLRLKPSFDAEYLGLNPEQSAKLHRQIEREWNLWAESKDCDAAGMHNFYELQQIAILSEFQSGDVFALLADLERDFCVYDLRIKLVEADRCNNKDQSPDTGTLMSGVEMDDDGMVKAYHFSNRHVTSYSAEPLTWNIVPVRGSETGRRNVLHLMNAERPDQRRGVPILAPVIESLKQLERYTDAELNAAVIASMFTVFIKKEREEELDRFQVGDGSPIDETNGFVQQNDELKMGNGAVVELQPGEEIQLANPTRPTTSFDPFVTSILRMIGSSLEVPYELLLKNFTSSYSASRGALLEAWKMFRMRRSWIASDFCQPVYEEFFAEAVTKGRIDAPGIFSDPLVFKAYTRAEWHGPSYGMLDPVKEVQAAILRIDNGLSTHQREAAELTGTEYDSNIRQLALEQMIKERHNVKSSDDQSSTKSANESENEDDSEDDSTEGGENE